jgi:hypothetical protein
VLLVGERLWFQHDKTPAHTAADVWQSLNVTYPERWIWNAGPTERPLVASLHLMDLCYWGHPKQHTVINLTMCTCNHKYLLFCSAPPTSFGPYRPSSSRSFTKKCTYNKRFQDAHTWSYNTMLSIKMLLKCIKCRLTFKAYRLREAPTV